MPSSTRTSPCGPIDQPVAHVKTNSILSPFLATAALCLLSACDYEFPATAGPTRGVDEKLVGDWITFDKDEHKDLAMHVRKLDEFNYVVSVDSDIYRAYHSDLDKLSLLSVQDLNSESRKYLFYTWKLSADGKQLTLRRVTSELVPESTKDAVALQSLLNKNAANPKLLGEELMFTRKPPPKIGN